MAEVVSESRSMHRVASGRRVTQGRLFGAASALFLIGGMVVLAAPAANAQVASTYFVGNTAAGTNSATDCTSNANNDCTLDDALTEVNNDASGNAGAFDVVNFIAASGTYGTDGVALQGFMAGASVTINGNGMTNTFVTGAGANQVFIIGSGVAATIVGLTAEDGSSGSFGGAIINQGALSLTNVTVTGSTAAQAGGGIASEASLDCHRRDRKQQHDARIRRRGREPAGHRHVQQQRHCRQRRSRFRHVRRGRRPQRNHGLRR